MNDFFNVGDSGTYDFGAVGPQMDGTFDIPVEAQQVNDPSATAGYPAASDSNAFDVLKYGVGAVSDIYKFNQGLDYKRYEATQGGTFQQGSAANVRRTANGRLANNYLLFAGLAIALLIYVTHKG